MSTKKIRNHINSVKWPHISKDLRVQVCNLISIVLGLSNNSNETSQDPDKLVNLRYILEDTTKSDYLDFLFPVSFEQFDKYSTVSVETVKTDSKKIASPQLLQAEQLDLVTKLIIFLTDLRLPFIAYNLLAFYLASAPESEEQNASELANRVITSINKSIHANDSDSEEEEDETDSPDSSRAYHDAIDQGLSLYDKAQPEMAGDDQSFSRTPQKRVRFSLDPAHNFDLEETNGGRSNRLRLQDFARRRQVCSSHRGQDTDNGMFLFRWWRDSFLFTTLSLWCYLLLVLCLSSLLSLLIVMMLIPESRLLLLQMRWVNAVEQLLAVVGPNLPNVQS